MMNKQNIYFIIFGFLLFFTLLFLILFYYISTNNECYDSNLNFHDPKHWIWEYPSLLSKSECNEIIQIAKKQGMQKSQVKNFNVNNDYRVSETAWLSSSKYKIIRELFDKLEKIIHIPQKNFELLQVVHYHPNGFFKWHYDQCDEKEAWCKKEINRLKGYRFFTILIYLNDDYKGGITQFKHSKNKNKKYKQGDAVIFRNMNLSTCKIESKSYHQGSPVTSGEKWICNIWVRSNCNKGSEAS